MQPRTIRPICLALATLALTAAARAQTPSADELQDLRNQLKAAQDRKNELATANQKLQQQVAALEKKTADQTERLTASESRVYFLQQHYAAWQQFIDDNPILRNMWIAYFAEPDAGERVRDILGDGHWPFSIDG